MCGHDGHTACLVGFVPWFISNASKIPSNKSMRLIFQPSEEGPYLEKYEILQRFDEICEKNKVRRQEVVMHLPCLPSWKEIQRYFINNYPETRDIVFNKIKTLLSKI